MRKWISLLFVVAMCVTISGCTNPPVTSTSSDEATSSNNLSNDISQTTSSDDTTSSSNSSNDTSQTSSSSSGTSVFSENEKIEELINKYHQNKEDGYCVDYDNDRIYVNFDGTKVYIPMPRTKPILRLPCAYSLRDDVFVFAILRDWGHDEPVSIFSTTDKGKSWQSSELDIGDYWLLDPFEMAFRNAEEGILLVKDDENDSGDYAIFATEDTGMTWSPIGSLSNISILCDLVTFKGSYWIAGNGESHLPSIFKSNDGVDWKEVQISIDTAKYTSGTCNEVYFSGEMGLARVEGYTPNHSVVEMWYFSEDCGETWSFYKRVRIT